MSQLGSVGGTGLTLGVEDDRRRSSAARPCFPQTSDTAQLELLSGPHLRDEGVARVDANTPEQWKDAADSVIRALAALCAAGERECFTAEDVRAVVGDPPGHANAMGGRFYAAVKAGVIRGCGWTRSTRPAAHACRLQMYTAGDEA